MNIKVTWLKTHMHVFNVIFNEHHDKLHPVSTYTDSEGTDPPPLGKGYPYILTEWGFENADCALIKHIQSKPDHFLGEPCDWTHEYFIARVEEASDE